MVLFFIFKQTDIGEFKENTTECSFIQAIFTSTYNVPGTEDTCCPELRSVLVPESKAEQPNQQDDDQMLHSQPSGSLSLSLSYFATEYCS